MITTELRTECIKFATRHIFLMIHSIPYSIPFHVPFHSTCHSIPCSTFYIPLQCLHKGIQLKWVINFRARLAGLTTLYGIWNGIWNGILDIKHE